MPALSDKETKKSLLPEKPPDSFKDGAIQNVVLALTPVIFAAGASVVLFALCAAFSPHSRHNKAFSSLFNTNDSPVR